MRDSKKSESPLFRTLVPCVESKEKIFPNSRLLFIGSCFTQNIGNKFAERGLNVCLNPFGIVYNPLSIFQQLSHLVSGKVYQIDELKSHNGLYHTFDHHSAFSDVNPLNTLNKINREIELGAKSLKECSFLFITLGTAYVYLLKENDLLVANCHKYPSKYFNKQLLDVTSIVSEFSNLWEKLKKYNPNLKVVFSVSPIRHLADGFIENNISKSTLLLAISKIIESYEGCCYFPAYEIVMDELRDYRFYADDMIHPNEVAVDYIWRRVKESFLDSSAIQMISEVEKLKRDLSHRPFNPESEEFKKFFEEVKCRIALFKSRYSECNIFFDK